MRKMKTMNKFGFAMAATLVAATCSAVDLAKENWKVPNWCPIVTQEGAVKEWIGKTWSGHVQGMCVSSNALYFSFHDQIVKTDWYGREQRWVQVDVHGADGICQRDADQPRLHLGGLAGVLGALRGLRSRLGLFAARQTAGQQQQRQQQSRQGP